MELSGACQSTTTARCTYTQLLRLSQIDKINQSLTCHLSKSFADVLMVSSLNSPTESAAAAGFLTCARLFIGASALGAVLRLVSLLTQWTQLSH